ncbi:MAG: hypothetical protein IPH20_04125 [Bacteroidales bacterium]|nr:hypothetical protein [Bacteroidales bacterium]
MITEKTNTDVSGQPKTEATPPQAGYNTLKGGDPYGSIYQCPDQCEGSKTYEQPLNCPFCNKKMILVAQNK